MKYLLDVNVLVAWGWANHAEHTRVAAWIGECLAAGGTELLTSAIPQLGFVRVSVQQARGEVTPQVAGEALAGMLACLGKAHQFIPDDQTATVWPAWCRGASATTDAHLLALAAAHGAELATLDERIPGGFVIPRRRGPQGPSPRAL